MSDATTFAGLFGAVFSQPAQTESGVVYGPLGNDLTGTAVLSSVTQSETLSLIEAVKASTDLITGVQAELAKVPRAPVAIAAGKYRLTIEGGQSQNLTPGAPTP